MLMAHMRANRMHNQNVVRGGLKRGGNRKWLYDPSLVGGPPKGNLDT